MSTITISVNDNLCSAPTHLCTYAHQAELSEFVLPKQSLYWLNNCADGINMVINYQK